MIYGATDTNLLISSTARDGTALSGTMVNGVIQDSWLGYANTTADYNIRLVDANFKTTDWHVINNYFSNSKKMDLFLTTSAGWNVQGNHFYGAKSAQVERGNVGTRFVDNYCETECTFYGCTTGFPIMQIGPGNYFMAHVYFNFYGTGYPKDIIVSTGNSYGKDAEIRHSYFDSEKVVACRDDVFAGSQPFKFYSSGSEAASSNGIIQIQDCLIGAVDRTITTTVTGPNAASNLILRCPDSWSDGRYISPAQSSYADYKGNYPREIKTARFALSTIAPIQIEVLMPGLLDDKLGYLVEVRATGGVQYNGAPTLTYKWEGHLVKKPGVGGASGTYHFQPISSILTPAEWTTAPALSTALENNFLVIKFNGTPMAADGYGTCTMQVRA
jgi:hypothetical protein